MPIPKIYWCTTEDRSEDWFVVERDRRKARNRFADYNGYDRNEVVASLVCHTPSSQASRSSGPTLGLASEEDIEWFGGRVIRRDLPRIVYLGGRFFTEGGLQAAIDILQGAQYEQAAA